MANKLIVKGCKLDIKDPAGKTAQDWAIERGFSKAFDETMIRLPEDGGPYNAYLSRVRLFHTHFYRKTPVNFCLPFPLFCCHWLWVS